MDIFCKSVFRRLDAVSSVSSAGIPERLDAFLGLLSLCSSQTLGSVFPRFTTVDSINQPRPMRGGCDQPVEIFDTDPERAVTDSRDNHAGP